MKKEFALQQAKFIYSNKELGYQEVLNEFHNAKYITIITYNISEKQHRLLDHLKTVPESTVITIITNIPNRWDAYYGVNYRELAKKKIGIYMSKLKPNLFGENASVFFNFDNHGKIVMTDTVVYVGSSNYSEESENNSEFGFISRDAGFIEFLENELLPTVKADAVPYYEYDYTSLALEANMALAAIFNINNQLHEETYALHDDLDGEWFYYIDNEDTLDSKTLEAINEVLGSSNKIASDIYDAVSDVTDSNDADLDQINDIYERLLDLSKTAEKYIETEEIYELANFGYNDFINDLLQTDYAMEAYEDNLENCIEQASERASLTLFDLCMVAKDPIDNLLETIKGYQDVLSELVDRFSQYGIKKVNKSIDNT